MADPPDDLWRISLTTIFALHVVSAAWVLKRMRELDYRNMARLDTTVVIAGFPLGLVVLAAQLGVVVGILGDVRFAYVASVGYFLGLAALAFSFSLITSLRDEE